MSTRSRWLARVRDIPRRFPRTSTAIGLAVLILVVVWGLPRRLGWVVSVDGRQWSEEEAPPRRQVVWLPAAPLEGILPEGDEPAALVTPRLTDGGATLYFTRRDPAGGTDIWRSRFRDGQWQPAEPVAELNTEADELGPTPGADGRTLYFFSNRPGGLGGFDLYVAHREGRAWGTPVNLGPEVNSPAHEYDPAPGPDGRALVFASNRTPQMGAAAAEEAPWSATARAHPGLTSFDLYVARRETDAGPWQAPGPLAGVNEAAWNEAAPFFSPDGGFLYFASDRPARDGEPRNLDLYRARLIDGRPVAVESLGPTVNTAAHETEPALSPEGFRLVFARGQDSQSWIYESSAREVFRETTYDISHWALLTRLWWSAGLPLLLLIMLLWVLWFRGDWLIEKATLARFLIASLLVHLLILFLLYRTPLPEVILSLVTTSEQAQGPSEPLADGRHQATQGAEMRFEAAADPAPAASAEVASPERTAAAIPDSPDLPRPLQPTLPAHRARSLPPERVHFEPPRMDPTPLPPTPLARRLAEGASPAAALSAMPAAEPRPEAGPREQPTPEAAVGLERQAPAPNATPSLELPPRTSLTPPRAAPLTPRASAAPEPAETALTALPAPLTGRTRPSDLPGAALEMKEVQVTGAVGDASPSALDPAPADTRVARRLVSGPEAPTAGAMPRSLVDLPAPGSPSAAARTVAGVKEAEGEAGGPTVTRLPDRLVRAPARPGVVELPGVEAGPAPAPGGEPAENPLPGAGIKLTRADRALPGVDTDLPAAPLPSPLGARRPLSPVGLEGVPDGEVPMLTPVPGGLPRRGAAPGQVALADDTPFMRRMFSLRQPEARKDLTQKLGGTRESEEAVERGLAWLAAHQSGDGSWSLGDYRKACKHPRCSRSGNFESDTGATALALLPFLGAGYTHKTAGAYQATVGRGLDWLVRSQRDNGGLLDRSPRPMYGHGLAAIVLCEAYGMTADPALRQPAQKTIDFIAWAQHPRLGGWRYTPRSADCDTSVVGWQVMALKSAEMAGLSVPEQSLRGVEKWLASVETKTAGGGLFGYTNSSPRPAMTAQALLSLQLLGIPRDSPRLQAGVKYLLGHLPERRRETSYYWYHATQVMHHYQGEAWQKWNPRMRDLLVRTQSRSGHDAGSWDPEDDRERTGGRIYATSLRLLMLEVYYRHLALPLYRLGK